MTWDCNSKTLNIHGSITHRTDAVDPEPLYGLTATLNDVSPFGDHKAAMTISFFSDWGHGDENVIIAPGGYKEYTDPAGDLWRVYVDSTVADGTWSTADCRACYDEPAAASGEIVSIDVPAAATAGQTLETYTTIKNIGGTKGKFFLRFYDGATLIHEGLPGWVESGATLEDLLENPVMPDHTWNGRIELIRE